MRLLVTGGRDFNDADAVNATLDVVHVMYVITELIEGGATGADTLARKWAVRNKIPVVTYFAEWEKYGKSAGHRRNTQMLEEGAPEMCVSFPGGTGTADMTLKCRKANVPVIMANEQTITASDDHDNS